MTSVYRPPYHYLSANVRGSFAYKTVKDRMPVIVTKVIDFLCRNKKSFGNNNNPELDELIQEDMKTIIGKLSMLRSEMQTNKPLQYPLTSQLEDYQTWNKILLSKENGSPRWFSSSWLLVECYMYRVINAAFEESIHLKGLDAFTHLKQEALFNHESVINEITAYTHEISLNLSQSPSKIGDHFATLIETCLWGNRNDLSLSAGSQSDETYKILDDIEQLKSSILVNQSSEIWQHVERVKKNPGSRTLSIITDNAGLEIVTDLCLAVFCISQNLFDRVDFYVKKIPWFVSDVTFKDLLWVLQEISGNSISPKSTFSKDSQWLGESCLQFLQCERFRIIEESYWTLPLPYHVMNTEDPKLYEKLSKSDLLIFKGDLNYRKLGGDISWPCTTSFHTFLQGFSPAPLVALRTIKAEIVSELPVSKVDELGKSDPEWMEKGFYGLIQFDK